MDTINNNSLMQAISRRWHSLDPSSKVLRHEFITQLYTCSGFPSAVHTHTTARCHNSDTHRQIPCSSTL